MVRKTGMCINTSYIGSERRHDEYAKQLLSNMRQSTKRPFIHLFMGHPSLQYIVSPHLPALSPFYILIYMFWEMMH